MNPKMLAALIAMGALSFAPTALAQERDAPRELIERGRISEDHRRDFKEARRLYERALKAAKAAGDKAAMKAARARLEALARRERGEADAEDEAAIKRRLKQLERTITQSIDPKIQATAAANLRLYGDRALPVLRGLVIDWGRSVAAEALVAMKSPGADRVLSELLSSPDPILRKMVTKALSAESNEALLLKALEDKVPGVRAPIYDLALKPSPRVSAAMDAGARAGFPGAIDWIARVSPEKIPGYIMAEGLPKLVRARSTDTFYYQIRKPGFRRWASVCDVIEAEHARGDHTTFKSAVPVLEHRDRRSLEPATRARFERIALGQLVSSNKEIARYAERLLTAVGGLDLVRAALSRRVEISDSVLEAVISELRPEDRSGLAAALTALPESAYESDHTFAALSRMAAFDERGEAARAAAFFDALPARGKSFYIYKYLKSRDFDAAGRAAFGSRLVEVFRALISQAYLDTTTLNRFVELACSRAPLELLPELFMLKRLEFQPRLLLSLRPAWEPKNSSYTMVRYERIIDAIMAKHPKQSLAYLQSLLEPQGGFDAGRDAPAKDWPYRSLLALSLISRRDEADTLATFDALWSRLRHPSLRESMVENLLSLSSAGASRRLLTVYPKLESQGLRVRALQLFGNELMEEALPHIEAGIKDRSPLVRKAAVKALKAFKEQRQALKELRDWQREEQEQASVLEQLLPQLKSPKRAVVLGAIAALGALRDKAALPSLVALLAKADKEMERAIRAAIARIGGSSKPI